MLLKPFVINSHGRIVFPGNFFPELDFSVFKGQKQFAAVMRRDFGKKRRPTRKLLLVCRPANTGIATRCAVTWC